MQGVARVADEPLRFCLGIAYQAGPTPGSPRVLTADGIFFTAAELEKAGMDVRFENSQQIFVGDLYHVDGTEGAAQVVESYIYRGPDWDLGDGIVAKSGDWLVGAILDDRAHGICTRQASFQRLVTTGNR